MDNRADLGHGYYTHGRQGQYIAELADAPPEYLKTSGGAAAPDRRDERTASLSETPLRPGMRTALQKAMLPSEPA